MFSSTAHIVLVDLPIVLSHEEPLTNQQLLDLIEYHVGEANKLFSEADRLVREAHRHLEQKPVYLRKLNARLPILSLPNEIITDVFLYYRDISLSSISSQRKGVELDPSTSWWFVPTHTCHHWREVLLATPLFWTSLDTLISTCSDTLYESFERSCDLPLDITFKADNFAKGRLKRKYTVRVIKRILRVSSRIRRLILDVPIESQGSFMETVQCEPFSQLEKLSIKWSLFNDCELTPAIFVPMPHRLRSITLVEQKVDREWLKTLPQTVTKLKIKFPNRQSTLTCADILDVLENLPRLEILELVDIPMQFQIANKRVKLPHLRSLHLEESHSCSILFLLHSLSFPAKVTAKIECCDRANVSFPPAFLHSIIPTFGIDLPHPEVDFNLSIEYRIFYQNKLVIQMDSDQTSVWPGAFELSIRLQEGQPLWREFLETIAHQLYPHAAKLSLMGLSKFRVTDVFIEKLVRARNLKKIRLGQNDVAPYLPIMAPKPNEDIALPQLHEMWIVGWDWPSEASYAVRIV